MRDAHRAQIARRSRRRRSHRPVPAAARARTRRHGRRLAGRARRRRLRSARSRSSCRALHAGCAATSRCASRASATSWRGSSIRTSRASTTPASPTTDCPTWRWSTSTARRSSTYCDARGSTCAARLALFAQVLDAVQYAHANLVVHRDLKPSNILVTARRRRCGCSTSASPSCSATTTPRAARPQLTQLGGRALTPDYASPEQIQGEPLTIATDVYSLGVVLYELLAGQRPYQLQAAVGGAARAGDRRRSSRHARAARSTPRRPERARRARGGWRAHCAATSTRSC